MNLTIVDCEQEEFVVTIGSELIIINHSVSALNHQSIWKFGTEPVDYNNYHIFLQWYILIHISSFDTKFSCFSCPTTRDFIFSFS